MLPRADNNKKVNISRKNMHKKKKMMKKERKNNTASDK
jgi:hypothetical protein